MVIVRTLWVTWQSVPAQSSVVRMDYSMTAMNPLAILVVISLIVLLLTMASYFFMETAVHLLLAGFLLGLGYGVLQPLFQSFVTGTTPAPKRGAANATYLLSYDIGIGIGSFVMGLFQDGIGLSTGFAMTAIAYIAGGIFYALYTDRHYAKLLSKA